MSITLSLYEMLGIPMSATTVEIKEAYRKMARTCHPDAVAFPKKETSATEFMKIHSAYVTLSDPNKRAYYDRQYFRQPRVSVASSKWETDQCW
ncbi:chaperone protein dnaJ 11, chloroplastic-like [Lycium barbarum]|uniref:chaperone protein dnaJ 11, chloroplastic-like n=1 Tax=Lycium ferocissimum TaxID=112874 RepID=UPI002815B69D|nr:chaperone protein dnaJ 11, chloroplastic-like [Lycium ferocissimum]XP_060217329.1 chaperone protein dnaJ 11, chloroplastic-like [Lycium barbarum]